MDFSRRDVLEGLFTSVAVVAAGSMVAGQPAQAQSFSNIQEIAKASVGKVYIWYDATEVDQFDIDLINRVVAKLQSGEVTEQSYNIFAAGGKPADSGKPIQLIVNGGIGPEFTANEISNTIRYAKGYHEKFKLNTQKSNSP
jgi:hypothetical protein